MIRAILFLLVICSAIGISFAQVDLQQESSAPAATDGQVEKDPDELGTEVPFEVQQEALPPEVTSPTPENNNNTTATTTDSPAANSSNDPKNFTDGVLLQGLNKITARTSKLEVKLGDSIKFGNLKLTLHSCWKAPAEEDPENKALLEMWEEIPGEPRVKIFSGWMFSSSPLISAPEHPVYDITVLGCTGSQANIVKKTPEVTEKNL